MRRGLIPALLVLAALVGAFAWYLFRVPDQETAGTGVSFEQVAFDALQGWQADDLSGFRGALQKSCARWLKRSDALATALSVPCNDIPDADKDLRGWLTEGWRVWRIDATDGRLTGYFEPVYRGSRTQSPDFSVPLYRVPDELITARFADFGRGKGVIRGQVRGKRLVPYHDRKAIREGALAGRGLELFWLADPVDAFFLQIQGSGRIALPDGSVAYAGYAGQNGHAYHAIGRDLIASGAVKRADMSMQAIRTWLNDNPAKASELMDRNPSYVFFTERTQPGAIGAEGVVLTPERSIAVDRRIWHFGLPFWIDAGAGLRRLAMGQDTGGAIRGPARADLFLGAGDQAGEKAGRMNEPLTLWLLLPEGVAPGLALR